MSSKPDESCVPAPGTVLKGGLTAFQTPLPASAADWEAGKPRLRQLLHRRLGDWPPLFTPRPTIDSRENRDGYTLERLSFDNGIGDTVFGYLLIPTDRTAPGPAILYHHYHGDLYRQGKEEVLIRVFETLPFATGEELARKGFVVLCIDAYCFGQRCFQGPAGQAEEGAATEAALFKSFLWQGKTLWGMMLRDDTLALNYLAARPEVDPARIAAMGMSMGATRTWWLSALDDRIKVAVSVACLTRYQNLIAEGSTQYHGIYYYVPNLLADGIDAESIIGLIAPHPHLTLTGDRDPGSPAAGVRIINRFQEQLYQLYGQPDSFRGLIYPGVKHAYTRKMWAQSLDFLHRHL